MGANLIVWIVLIASFTLQACVLVLKIPRFKLAYLIQIFFTNVSPDQIHSINWILEFPISVKLITSCLQK